MKRAAVSTRAFNEALRRNPLTLIVSLFALAVAAVIEYKNAVDEAEEETKGLSRAQTALNSVAEKTKDKLNEERQELQFVFEQLKKTTAGTDERRKALDKINEQYGTTLQNLEDEAEFVRQVDQAYQDLLNTLD